MKEELKNAELLSILPQVIDQEVKIQLVFSDVAKWMPKELLKMTIPLSEWLQFLEDCFIQFKDVEHVITPSDISLEFQKSQVKLIGLGKYAFTVPKSKWQRFIQGEAEKLLLMGVVQV